MIYKKYFCAAKVIFKLNQNQSKLLSLDCAVFRNHAQSLLG